MLGAIEFVCCLALIAFYARRRSTIILAIVVLAFVASVLGTWAKLTLDYYGLLGHATFTIAIIGGFFIYMVIDMCLGTDVGA